MTKPPEKDEREKMLDLIGIHPQLLLAGFFVSRVQSVFSIFIWIYARLSWLFSDKGKVLRWLIIGLFVLYFNGSETLKQSLKAFIPW